VVVPVFENLSDLPRRKVIVPGWAVTFLVSRYIVRIDIDEPGLVGTHGWQVRYQKPFVLFSDSKGASRRSPRQSLAEAMGHLALTYQGPRNLLRTTPTSRKKNEIQEAGLRLVVMSKPHKTFDEFYIEAMSPTRARAARRVYVGTENTITLPRADAAIVKARKLRREMERDHLSGLGILSRTKKRN